MAEPATAEKKPPASQKASVEAKKGPPQGDAEPTAAPSVPTGASTKRSLVLRLAALLFLVAVVLGECLVAYRLLSSASAQGTAEAVAPAPTTAAKEHSPGEAAKAESGSSKSEHPTKTSSIDPLDEGDSASAPSPVEVDLGQFTVTTHQPAANTTMRIDFHLHGIIVGKDKEEFENTMKAVHQRFREQVLVTLRAAEGPDLADAGLGLIKRQILEKTNTLLGKRLLRTLIVSDFSYMEQ
jgi:flagellar FliL protein